MRSTHQWRRAKKSRMRGRQHAFATLSPETFTTFTKAQAQIAAPPSPYPSVYSELIHTQISHFAYGEWQISVHDVYTCLQVLYKLLNINLPPPPLLSQPDLDHVLINGLPPSTWTSPRHFGTTQH